MAKETVDSLCKKAQTAIAQGDSETAKRIYFQALGLQSDAPDVHYGLATVFFLLGDYINSAHHFKEVTRLDPLRAGAYINLGAVYNRLGQLDEALPVLRRGIQLDLNRAEGYYNLGLVYRRKDQLDLAIQAYREATRINPRMADAHYNLGNLYLEKEQFSLALAHYQHALELKPRWEKALHGLQQTEAAIEALESESSPSRNATNQVDEATTQENRDSARVSRDEMEREIDPDRHGNLLTKLHRATIDSENQGRDYLHILLTQMEPAIKELSNNLLYADSTRSDLDECIEKFESAIKKMQAAKRILETNLDRVRSLGDELLSK